MKILHVIASLSPRYGGPSGACPEMCREFARRGHEVTVYTTMVHGDDFRDVPLERPESRDGYQIRYFPAWRILRDYRFSPALLRALREDVRKFDLLHVWAVYCFPAAAAAYICRRSRVPYLLLPHGSLDPYLVARHAHRKWLYTRLVAADIFRHAAAIQFCSTEELRQSAKWMAENCLPEGQPGWPELAVIPPPVAVEWLAPESPGSRERFLEKFPELAGKKIVLFFGRLSFKKGMDILAEAFVKVARERDDVHLLVAGPDPEGFGGKIRARLRAAGISEKATFSGLLVGEERFAPLRLATVFVLPSYGENFGHAVIEAMACRVPVVISDKVCLWPEVRKAGAGLVTTCDAGETARALQQILASPEASRKMGESGRQWVEENLTWKNVGEQLLNLYGEVARVPARLVIGAQPSRSLT